MNRYMGSTHHDVEQYGLKVLKANIHHYPVIAILTWMWLLASDEAVDYTRMYIMALTDNTSFENLADNCSTFAAVYIHIYESLHAIGHSMAAVPAAQLMVRFCTLVRDKLSTVPAGMDYDYNSFKLDVYALCDGGYSTFEKSCKNVQLTLQDTVKKETIYETVQAFFHQVNKHRSTLQTSI